jgi:hypothetical protein
MASAMSDPEFHDDNVDKLHRALITKTTRVATMLLIVLRAANTAISPYNGDATMARYTQSDRLMRLMRRCVIQLRETFPESQKSACKLVRQQPLPYPSSHPAIYTAMLFALCGGRHNIWLQMSSMSVYIKTIDALGVTALPHSPRLLGVTALPHSPQ